MRKRLSSAADTMFGLAMAAYAIPLIQADLDRRDEQSRRKYRERSEQIFSFVRRGLHRIGITDEDMTRVIERDIHYV